MDETCPLCTGGGGGGGTTSARASGEPRDKPLDMREELRARPAQRRLQHARALSGFVCEGGRRLRRLEPRLRGLEPPRVSLGSARLPRLRRAERRLWW